MTNDPQDATPWWSDQQKPAPRAPQQPSVPQRHPAPSQPPPPDPSQWRPADPAIAPSHLHARQPDPAAQPGGQPTHQSASPGCQACHQAPAASVKFTKCTGMVITRRTQTVEGVFCRSCGLAVFRSYMNHTLWAGWWGLISFFANFGAVIGNVTSWQTVRGLGPTPRPCVVPEGRPLWQRFGLYVAIGVVVFFAIVFVGALLSDTTG